MSTQDKNIPPADIRAQLDSQFHRPLTAYFARRIKDKADAEDLTQETMLRAINAPAVDHLEHAERYVFTIASNVLSDYHRKLQRFDPNLCIPIEEAVACELEQLVEGSTPETVLLSKDSLKEALAMLDELGERTRDIFVLFRLENMKQKDIAAAYGIGLSTVEKHVMRAVIHLMAARQGGNKR